MEKNFFEKKSWKNSKYVCGIDEVGRGCLAGPLVTCAMILPLNTNYELLKDSKILCEEKRKKAYEWIKKNCIYSIAISDNYKIDKFNIYQSTLVTMKKSLIQLFQKIPFSINKIESVLIDAMPLAIPKNLCHEKLSFHHFNKGETYSTSIAAASIAAKVFRDDLIEKIGRNFPKFELKQNKGYGTASHVKTLQKIGPTIIHRHTFTPKKCIQKQNSIF